MRIDFGDGGPALVRNAEELRQQPLLQHLYTRPQLAEVRIEALQEPTAEVLDPGSEIVVGEGRLAFTVGPSRISLTRSAASFFFSLRFALALAVGLLIQGWRLWDEHPFGSRSRDYLEAFALGAGIEGVIEALTKVFAGLVG